MDEVQAINAKGLSYLEVYRACKDFYPDNVVLIAQNGRLFSYGKDAEAVIEICGVQAYGTSAHRIASFSLLEAEEQIAKIVSTGREVAILEPEMKQKRMFGV
jgi:DNA mismatch repair ATPase MutS